VKNEASESTCQSHHPTKQQVTAAPHTPSPTPFHANNLICHSCVSPFKSHPKENISATVDNLLTRRSNNPTYLTSKIHHLTTGPSKTKKKPHPSSI